MRNITSYIFSLSSAILLAASCLKIADLEFLEEREPYMKAVSCKVEYEDEDDYDTKSSINNSLKKALFTKGDSISVYGGTPFVCTNSYTTTCILKGTLTQKCKSRLMVYPFSKDIEYRDSLSAIVSLPSIQRATASSFGPKANLSVALLNENNEKVLFRNSLSAIRFTITPLSPLFNEIQIQSLNGEPLCGDFLVRPDASIVPAGNNSSVVSLKGAFSSYTDFYIMIPPRYYAKGLKVTFLFNGAIIYSRTIKPTLFARSRFYSFGEVTHDSSYTSSDYSQDGKLSLIHKSAYSRAINLIITGDGFSDRQIRSGLFYAYVKDFINGIFSEKILYDHMDCFNIYIVNKVSKTEGNYGNNTVFGLSVNEKSINGADVSLGQKISSTYLPSADEKESCVVVLLNSIIRNGVTYSMPPFSNNYGRGLSVCYATLNKITESRYHTYKHEVIGHGIAKLADEYSTNTGTIPLGDKIAYSTLKSYGWYFNIDFTNSSSSVSWAPFLTNSAYANCGFGVYEGGQYYAKGTYRPTETSIMRSNENSSFNAVHRYAIFRRLVNTCGLKGYSDSFSSFIEFDKPYNQGNLTVDTPAILYSEPN